MSTSFEYGDVSPVGFLILRARGNAVVQPKSLTMAGRKEGEQEEGNRDSPITTRGFD